MHQEAVPIISFQDLIGNSNLNGTIEESFGPKGLGILFVKNIPQYVQARRRLLLIIHKLGTLPKDVLALCQRSKIFYTRGWSCGNQKFNGQPDYSKGSYYFKAVKNQAYECPPDQQSIFTDFDKLLFSQNVWLPQHLPQLEVAALQLSRLLIKVGILLAQKIDSYLVDKVNNYAPHTLTKMIKEGEFHVGRLLHYFPFEEKQNKKSAQEGGDGFADWCGWHNDHGALTALTSALYTNQNGQEKSFPLQTGGLYAKARDAHPTRIKIPSDCLAFQIGQSMQILSGGHLQATPHAVTKSQELGGEKISRNTFALFMQPNPLVAMKVPQGQHQSNVIENEAFKVPPIKKRWENGQFFKDFHHKTIMTYVNQTM